MNCMHRPVHQVFVPHRVYAYRSYIWCTNAYYSFNTKQLKSLNSQINNYFKLTQPENNMVINIFFPLRNINGLDSLLGIQQNLYVHF